MELLGELAPGDLQDCFFINNGTDAVEGALKLARLYTRKVGFIAATGGFKPVMEPEGSWAIVSDGGTIAGMPKDGWSFDRTVLHPGAEHVALEA